MPMLELCYQVPKQGDKDGFIKEMDDQIQKWLRYNKCVHVSKRVETRVGKLSKIVFPRVSAWPWTKTYVCHTIDHGSNHLAISDLPQGVSMKKNM